MKRIPLMLRLLPRDHAMLKVCAKAYRAPSLNWFISEMVACMLNPARWQEFSMRLSSGAQQQTFDLGQSVTDITPRRSAVAGTRKRVGRRGSDRKRRGNV